MENTCAIKLNKNRGHKIVWTHCYHNCIQRKLNVKKKIRKGKNKMLT